MFLGKIKKNNLFIGSIIFFIAVYVTGMSCLNPLGMRNIDSDTSVFLTIAQGINRGQVPYLDFYDNKGPLTYLISAFGMYIGRFVGVWLIELVVMLVSVSFAYKTALFFGNRYQAMLGTICSFIVFSSFFYEVAGTEEYSLPFAMISLYIFTKYYFTDTEPRFFELICLGICFASSMLLRINMFPLWLSFCIVIFVELVIKRKFSLLHKCVFYFVLGILIVTIPVFLYLTSNGALDNYIKANFESSSTMVFSGFTFEAFIKSIFVIIGKNYCFSPLILGTLLIAKNIRERRLAYYIAYILAFVLTVVFIAVIRASFDHYNMVLTPFLIPTFTCFVSFVVKNVRQSLSNTKYSSILILICFLIALAQPILFGLNNYYKLISDKSRNDLVALGKIIDSNTTTGDSVIFLGFPARIYLFTERVAASKYIYQVSGASYVSGMQNEFIEDIKNENPAVIAIADKNKKFDHLPDWYEPIYQIIGRDYELLSDTNGYFLFLKK